VVQVPLVALKMSTTLQVPPVPAQDISNQRWQLKQTSQFSELANILPPHTNNRLCNQCLQHMLRTTDAAAGEYCESIIRQRCGCKCSSSDA